MIEKMTKYNFILLNEEQEVFLQKLQEMGVVDITRSTKPVDDSSSQMLEKAEELKKAKALLEMTKFEGVEPSKVESSDPASDAFQTAGEIKELGRKIDEVSKEIAERLPWGDFDKSQLASLESLGYKIRYYHVSAKAFDSLWETMVPLQVIKEDEKDVWFVTVSDDPEYSFPVNEIQKPQGPASESAEELAKLQESQKNAQAKLLGLKSYESKLDSQYSAALSDLDRYLAKEGSDKAVENHVSVLEGFAPAEEEERLSKEFDSMGIFWYKADAVIEDNPPIKLRNNRFAKLFESLTGMYGMPIYGEFDPTPILSVFFMLFFAMCMGDAGYGIVLLVFGIALNKKWVDFEMFRGLGTLISILGGATFVVGMILGTCFGVNLYQADWVPAGMKRFMISDDIKIMGYSAQMVLAIGIGIFHICLAMIVKTALHTYMNGFKNSLATWGWTLLIVGGVLAFGLGMALGLDPDIIKWIIIAIGAVSCMGIFVFNTPGRNPLINIGAGLWDTYQMVTGLLGDLLSYIRLYALGLAGGLLGGAFNTLGQMVLGGHPTWQWVPFAIILVLGHTLNVLMSGLGAFVHPLRLTFVEYFKNSGYTGEGRLFNPLKNNNE